MSKKLLKFLILFDNTSLLYFPGQFLSGRVLIELQEDTPALGEFLFLFYFNTVFVCFILKTIKSQNITHNIMYFK